MSCKRFSLATIKKAERDQKKLTSEKVLLTSIDDWGADPDENILKLATQACERVESEFYSEPFDSSIAETFQKMKIVGEESDKQHKYTVGSRNKRHNIVTVRNESKTGNMDTFAAKMQELLKELHGLTLENERLKSETSLIKDRIASTDGEASFLRKNLRKIETNMVMLRVAQKDLNKNGEIRFERFDSRKFGQPLIKKSFKPDTRQLKDLYKKRPLRTQSKPQSKYNRFPLKFAIDKSIFNSSTRKTSTVTYNKDIAYLLRTKRLLQKIGACAKTIIPKKSMSLKCIYVELIMLMEEPGEKLYYENCIYQLTQIRFVFNQLIIDEYNKIMDLAAKSPFVTPRKENMEHYQYASKKHPLMTECRLFDESSWYENEQAVELRRMIAVLSALCDNVKNFADVLIHQRRGTEVQRLLHKLKALCNYALDDKVLDLDILTMFTKICQTIGQINSSHLYVGLITSMCHMVNSLVKNVTDLDNISNRVHRFIREVLLLKPHAMIVEDVTSIIHAMENNDDFLDLMCQNYPSADMKFSYLKVPLYNEDTCTLQLLCNNIEIWSEHYIDVEHMEALFIMTQNLIDFYQKCNQHGILWTTNDGENECLCFTKFKQSLCVCLHKCINLYNLYYYHLEGNLGKNFSSTYSITLKAGIIVLSMIMSRDIQSFIQLGDYERHLHMFIIICKKMEDELKMSMLKHALDDLYECFVPKNCSEA